MFRIPSCLLIMLLTVFVSAASAAAPPLRAVCAVCREGEEPVAASVVHDGRTYNFCSTGCKVQFQGDPARWTAPAERPPEDERAGSSASFGSSAPSCPV